MAENIKVRWLTDHEQTKIAPKTLASQVLNEDGTHFKDAVENAIANVESEVAVHASNSEIHVTAEEKEAWSNIEVPSLEGYATEEYVKNLYEKINSSTTLSFYCIEDVTIITNGISKIYPANSTVELQFAETDVFEIVTTSDSSILSLTAFPGALGTFYPWLEGVALFSNILFDMNAEDMYVKWSQGQQGEYHVQSAQYSNCIFWSDNPYISDVNKRTNYVLTHTAQLPLCYSTIPENTFKTFYLASGVISDPNWANQAYLDSFAEATWATQVFSYYGARVVGLPGLWEIVLPKDCRGLMFDARNIECAGTFNAINTTNFGAKSGSWREAFGDCTSLRRLYIKNLKVSLNISWSPIDYNSIYYIISEATNTSAITISVSPYTYNLLSPSDFELATSKNITIALLTTNYVEDKRLSAITLEGDGSKVLSDDGTYKTLKTSQLENDSNFVTDVDDSLSVTSTNPVQNKIITERIDSLNVLIGDTAVSEQISEAINNLEIPEGFSGSWVDLTDKPFYEYDEKELVGWTNGTMTEPTENTSPSNRFVYTVSRDFHDTYVIQNQTIDIDIESMGMQVTGGTDVVVKPMLYNNVTGYIYGCGNIALYDGTSFQDFSVDTESSDEDYLILFDTRGYYAESTDDTVNVILTTNNSTLTSGQARYVGLRLRKSDVVTKYVCLDEQFIPDTIARVSDVEDIVAAIPTPDVSGQIEIHNTSEIAHSDIRTAIDNVKDLVGDTSVSEQIAVANIIYVGPDEPTDPNIKVWINTSEEGTGVVPVLPRITTITLDANNWTGETTPYSQIVEVNTVTSATKIELNPTAAQIVDLQNADIALMAENSEGVVTVYSFGGKPSVNMSIQATLMEVSYV